MRRIARVVLILSPITAPGLARAGDPDIDSAQSRVLTVSRAAGIDPLSIQDATSRILTVDNVAVFPSLDIGDGRSRIFTVSNTQIPEELSIEDAGSRAVTVFNELPFPALEIDDARSRAMTVENEFIPTPLAIDDVSSRGITLVNCLAAFDEPALYALLPDCNGNGVADRCDLVLGLNGDCNSTGIIDDCDEGPCPTCLGDLNADGRASGDDVQIFIDVYLSSGTAACGDIDLSGGALDETDISQFVCRLLTAGPMCPPP